MSRSPGRPPAASGPTLYGGLWVGVVAVSGSAVFVKLSDLSAANIAAGRMTLAVLLMAPFALRPAWRAWKDLDRKEAALLVLAGVGLGVHFAVWVASLKYTSVASSVILVTTNPLFVSLGSRFLLKEPLSRGLIAGMVVAGVGAACVAWTDARGPGHGLTGDLLALAGAVMFSVYLLAGARLRKTLSTAAYTFPVYVICAGFLLLLAAGLNPGGLSEFARADGREWTLLLLMAVVPTLIGHNCLNWVLGRLSSPVVATAILGEPVLAPVFAYFILGEGISAGLAVGGGLILAGVFVAVAGAASESVGFGLDRRMGGD